MFISLIMKMCFYVLSLIDHLDKYHQNELKKSSPKWRSHQQADNREELLIETAHKSIFIIRAGDDDEEKMSSKIHFASTLKLKNC